MEATSPPVPAPGRPRVIALCGDAGGIAVARGFYHLLGEGELAIVASVGGDFEHVGLHVSPALDAICGALADHVIGDTDRVMAAVRRLGGEARFQQSDVGLAMALLRTEALRAGGTLTEASALLARGMALHARILPMSDDPVQTRLETDAGTLTLAEFRLRGQAVPDVRTVHHAGVRTAAPNPALVELLRSDHVELIVLCSADPLLAIDPILALPGMRQALRHAAAPLVAVSPLIDGQGADPQTARIMASTGLTPSAAGVADHYEDLLDAFVLDHRDEGEAAHLELPIGVAAIAAGSRKEEIALAAHILDLAQRLGGRRHA